MRYRTSRIDGWFLKPKAPRSPGKLQRCQQAADYAAQNLRWAVTILVSQILANGTQAVYPGATVSNLQSNNDAPNGPVYRSTSV